MYVKHLVVVTQHVWYICFVLFSKYFCLIKKPWFNGSIFPFLFYPHFSGICLKHTVNYSNIRAFRCNGEFQLLQKTLKEYFYKPQEYFCCLEVVWKSGFPLIQLADSKLFTLLICRVKLRQTIDSIFFLNQIKNGDCFSKSLLSLYPEKHFISISYECQSW